VRRVAPRRHAALMEIRRQKPPTRVRGMAAAQKPGSGDGQQPVERESSVAGVHDRPSHPVAPGHIPTITARTSCRPLGQVFRRARAGAGGPGRSPGARAPGVGGRRVSGRTRRLGQPVGPGCRNTLAPARSHPLLVIHPCPPAVFVTPVCWAARAFSGVRFAVNAQFQRRRGVQPCGWSHPWLGDQDWDGELAQQRRSHHRFERAVQPCVHRCLPAAATLTASPPGRPGPPGISSARRVPGNSLSCCACA